MKEASGWDKFVLLSWKNWIIQIRHPLQTLFEILVPVIVCSLIILIRGLVDVSFKDEISYSPLPINEINPLIRDESRSNVLAFSPSSPILRQLMERVAAEYEFILQPLADANSLESFAMTTNPFASIEFEDTLAGASQLPDEFNYAIRFPAELRTNDTALQRFAGFFFNWATNIRVTNEFTVAGPRNRFAEDGGNPPGYINQGFIALQNTIEREFISITTGRINEVPPIMIQRFPYPAYTDDIIGFILEFVFPLLFLIGFLYNCINIIKYITIEKEMQLKETMKIMGLPSWLHWLAWFTKSMIFMIIIISILTALFKIPFAQRGNLAVFTLTDFTVLWVFQFVYVLTAVTYSFMFSTFFNRANIAAIVGSIVWFMMQVPYNLINQNFATTSLTTKLVASLLCNTGMGFGFKLMNQYETAAVGAQWNNLFNSPLPEEDLTIGAVMVVMLFACVIQMLVALYVEKIRPGEFGVPEKFYFPFLPSFWCGKNAKIHSNHETPVKNNPDFEDEPSSGKVGVEIRGLRKVYDKKVAVKNLNLNMYEDQITVLLGHNGAGKSTTMSMLTGLYRPTAGTAYINGKDIRTDLNSIRSSLGLCPQHNVLFNELTVKEHITFFSKLKGMNNSKDIDEQIRKYVDLLELQPKLNAQSKTLSGGMKRKLSIGIALCGNSKVVMCDEPTSGMDPAARRALWDLLIQEKKGRTILLTTHFMDEADILGDRIAIMAEGDLKTVGSSFFLKKRHGVGYRLICVKAAGCDPSDMTALLQRYIPGIEIETSIGSELSYVLHEDYRSQFRVIFADLEQKSRELKISSFGVSLTTLEEVFLKVGSDSNMNTNELVETESNGSSSRNGITKVNGVNGTNGTNGTNGVNGTHLTNDALKMTYSDFLYGGKLHLSQINAMVSKKFLYAIRNYILLAIQFITPALFVILTYTSTRNFSGNQNLPDLRISFGEYERTTTTVEGADNLMPGSLRAEWLRNYQELWNDLPNREPFTNHELNPITTDLNEEILRQYEISTSRTNLEFMVGASFRNDSIVAWFNNQAFHTAPLTINVMNNAVLRHLSGQTRRRIHVINKPLPFTQESRLDRLGAGDNFGFQIAFNTGFAMGFVIALYVMFYIKERISRAKLLQFVSGVNKFIFWFTAFVIDYMVFILICLVYIGVLAAFQMENYQTFSELGMNFMLMIIFGLAALPLTYLLSFTFKVPSTGLVRLAILYIVTGVFAFMAYFVLSNEIFGLAYIADPLGWIFLIFPHYSLARGMSNINVMQSRINICKQTCGFVDLCANQGLKETCKLFENLPCDKASVGANPLLGIPCQLKNSCCDNNFYTFQEDGLLVHFTALVIICIVSFLLLFAVEYRWLQNLYFKIRKPKRPENIPESEDGVVDSDVFDEKMKVRTVTPFLQSTKNLVVKDLTKFYKQHMAVNQLCVTVGKSECFGLLGVNGAGKTSTFKMLTGDASISSGEAWVEGINIKTNMNDVHQRIGYCPQFDALFDDLTGRETLRIFCLLRGVHKRDIARISLQLADEFNFTKHLDKRTKAYSGGNKRKLSTALSLIGDPSVIYLDEPTSGMDVGARRQLWNMVIKARNAGKSVVLTSHSMEECEVLCTRLAIMVNGEFKCLGSTQHLKNKFSKGFFLTIKVGFENRGDLERRIVEIKNFASQKFAGSILKEEYMDILTYHIPTTNVQWSLMFGIMEEARERLNIADYSLGQTSLEQVFLFLTKKQRITA